VETLLPGATAWTSVASLPRPLAYAQKSIVRGNIRLIGGKDADGSFRSEVLEYHPEPWDQWVTVGNILVGRYEHAVLSVGPQQLPCLAAQCPPIAPSPGQLCVPPAGAQPCQYDVCCCGRCHTEFTCDAPDSITGSGIWQPKSLRFCPVEGCGNEGKITSTRDRDLTEHITVETGRILRLQFETFRVYPGSSIHTCSYGFVRITDGDGTTLMDNSCGYSDFDPSSSPYFRPPIITTKTNKVDIYSYPSDVKHFSWQLRWTTVEEGTATSTTTTMQLDRLS